MTEGGWEGGEAKGERRAGVWWKEVLVGLRGRG